MQTHAFQNSVVKCKKKKKRTVFFELKIIFFISNYNIPTCFSKFGCVFGKQFERVQDI